MQIFKLIKRNYNQWAPLFLRLAMGLGFMVHGWAKLSRGPAGFEKLLIQTGVPLPHITSWIVPFIELIGGFALIAGAFVTITVLPLIVTMLVAMFTVQIHYGFSSVKTIGLTSMGPVFGPPGYEINLLYIAGLISIFITGAGKYSVDASLYKRKKF